MHAYMHACIHTYIHKYHIVQEKTPECPSFIHLHLGFSAEGLKEVLGDKELLCHYMVVNDWDKYVFLFVLFCHVALFSKGCCVITRQSITGPSMFCVCMYFFCSFVLLFKGCYATTRS